MDKQREMFEAWWQESRPSCWVTDWYANMLQDIAWRTWQAALAAQPAVPDGYKLVPIEPTEEQWGGLARDIMMAYDLGGKSPKDILDNLRVGFYDMPQWFRDEVHNPESTAVLSKGTRAVLIYRAMIDAAP